MNPTEETKAQSDLARNHRKTSIFVILVFLVAGVFGLVGSFKVVMAWFALDPDSSHALLLWHGVQAHGLSWIKDWNFTQDNWLLSLSPLHFLLFLVFGPKISIVIFLGWIFYIGSAFLSAAITWKAGARKAAPFIFLCLINFGVYAHNNGFLSYSTTHNITNIFGLASLLIVMNWAERPRALVLLGLLVLLIFGAVSDPWMLAAYNLPILLLGVYLMRYPFQGMGRKQVAVLVGVSALSILSVKTRLFGIFNFVPSAHFSPGDWQTMNTNAFFLIKDLGGLLSLIPGPGENSFLGGLISLFVVFCLLLYGIFWILKLGLAEEFSRASSAFLIIAFISTAGILAAFVVTAVEAGSLSARFLINVVYLVVISIGIISEHVWRKAGFAYRSSVFGVYVLFLAASAFSVYPYLHDKSLNFRFKEEKIAEIISILKENKLTYGYGPYWGSNANAVTVASNFEIIIRPVQFEKNSGRIIFGNRPETSKRWYEKDDVPSGTSSFFVVVTKDGENCEDINICLDGLERQFGKPVNTISRGSFKILVWNHALIDYAASPILASYFFGSTGAKINGKGWSAAESWGVWSDGGSASLALNIKNIKKDRMEMIVNAMGYVNGKLTSQSVSVSVNGKIVDVLEYSVDRSAGERLVVFPGSLVPVDGTLNLDFFIKTPASPHEFGVSDDVRKLGLGLKSISFR